MPMSMKTHVHLRIGLFLAGFLGGGILFMAFSGRLGELAMPAFFIFPFGGAYLLPLAFSSAVAAACPKCGGDAYAGALRPLFYACRKCQEETDLAMALMGGEAAFRERIAEAEKEEPSRTRQFVAVFLLMGVVAAGIGVFLAIDTVRLVREGVSVDAQVMKVTATEGRDKDGNRETRYTAHIQYKVGETLRSLQSSWSEGSNSHCVVGCYGQGERLKVIYLPADPATARIHSVADLYLFPALPLSVGLIFIAFAVVSLRKKS
jgi:hypothetical protein